MGIKHFYIWFKETFGRQCIHGQNFGAPFPVAIDNLCVDMNGLFHPCAQQAFQYGEQAIKTEGPKLQGKAGNLQAFSNVAHSILRFVHLVRPRRRLVLCVDGVAGLAKCTQQRGRRYKTSQECPDNFNPAAISPGTEFMYDLMQFLDFFIKRELSYNREWEYLQVIFSDDRSAGEGEHKLMHYIRTFDPTESVCIHGLDADLFMLALSVRQGSGIHLLRENLYKRGRDDTDLHLVNIERFAEKLLGRMSPQDVESCTLNDFVFMCFLVGNDFLPNIPMLEIRRDGIDMMLQAHSDVRGGLTTRYWGAATINPEPLQNFLGVLAADEGRELQEKVNMMRRGKYMDDDLLLKHAPGDVLDMEGYRREYYETKFPADTSVESICHEYLRGMMWINNYYAKGIPSWDWFYPYDYAPFLGDLTEHTASFEMQPFEPSQSLPPFMQLMCIMPPPFAELLPERLRTVFSLCPDLFPEEFEVDLAGKRKEWEGIVLLPSLDVDRLWALYHGNGGDGEEERNTKHEDRIYTRGGVPGRFDCVFGSIPLLLAVSRVHLSKRLSMYN